MKALVTGLCMLLCAGLLQAQFTYGLKAGTNFGGPLGNIEGSGKPFPGIDAGVEIAYRFTPKSSLALNLLYTYYAANYSQVNQGDSTVFVTVGSQQVPVTTTYTNNVNGKLRLHYLTIPIWYRFNINKRMAVDAGPVFSYLFAGSDKGTNDVVFVENGIFNQKVAFNNFADLRKTDIAISLGGSYTTNYGLSIGLWALRGFRSLYRPGFFSARGVKEAKLYNTFMHLTIGYTFGKRKSE